MKQATSDNGRNTVLVVGGGIGGLQAALTLDDLGVRTVVVESERDPGGMLRRLDKLFPTNDCSDCILSSRLSDAAGRPAMRILTGAVVETLSGGRGRFLADLRWTSGAGNAVRERVEVGAVVLALGARCVDAKVKPEYGWGRFPNVVTGEELESWLRPGLPAPRELKRPSDGASPKNMAFLQCVGSRDVTCGNGYCSSVCCAAAVKEAVSAHELIPGLSTTLFFMDIRAQDKDMDSYVEEARSRFPMEFVYGRIAALEEAAESRNLRLQVETEDGVLQSREFGLVVLSVGMAAAEESRRTAERLGVDLTPEGFCRTAILSPLETSRPGVYVCGSFQEPKDVGETITQAQAAAVHCLADLGVEVDIHEPGERSVVTEPPRVGVFVCRCGGNVGDVLDVDELAAWSRGLPHVAYVETLQYACSDRSLGRMGTCVSEERLNRLVVAACSPRVLGSHFEQAGTRMGLSPTGVEMANIREQCAWVHRHGGPGVEGKARSLLAGAVAGVSEAGAVGAPPIRVCSEALVVGGGAAGMAAALALGRMGVYTVLLEQSPGLGGQARNLGPVWTGEDASSLLDDLARGLEGEQRVRVERGARWSDFSGSPGAFRSDYVTREGVCKRMEHGVLVLATGGEEAVPIEYGYGGHPAVMTHREMDAELRDHRVDPAGLRSVVFIQCVGSREGDRPYCSRICCVHSLQTALELKQENPRMQVYIFYRDIRTSGFMEALYRRARMAGVLFVRYSPRAKPRVKIRDGRVFVCGFDALAGKEVHIEADRLVLATGVVPGEIGPASVFAESLLDANGFVQEARMPVSRVETGVEGVFAAGLIQRPQFLWEAVVQGRAAAAKAVTWLRGVGRKTLWAIVDPEVCRKCLVCVEVCPYAAPALKGGKASSIDPVLCRACGVCLAECPAGAISMTSGELSGSAARIDAMIGSLSSGVMDRAS